MTWAKNVLVIGDAEVPAQFLERTVNETTSALERAGAGPGRPFSVCHATGLAPVVAMLASSRIGAPLVLESGQGDRPTVPALAQVRPLDGGRGVEVTTAPGGGAGEGPALADDIAAVFRSSGSTGDPKAVLLSWSALAYQAAATRERLDVGPGDEMMLPLPLTHSYGFSVLQLWYRYSPSLSLQSPVALHRVCAGLMTRPVTTLDGVPSFYRVLARRAKQSPGLRERLRDLRTRGCGGSSLSLQFARYFAHTIGAPLHDGYGLTEAGPNVALTSSSLYRLGTVGPPLEGTQVRVDERGELLVRGPGLMSGYYMDEEATRAAFTVDGWLRTGDIGVIAEDGFVQVIGRLKDVLNVHGEQHSPSTVEDALRTHPAVHDVAVAGVPAAAERGDAVVAFVVLLHDASLPTRRSLLAACRALPPQLRPVRVRVIERMPLLASGKVDRQEILRMARAEMAAWQ
jgi:acyl-CoA synthetase (AMP-forming)/AMP-acid ligase II